MKLTAKGKLINIIDKFGAYDISQRDKEAEIELPFTEDDLIKKLVLCGYSNSQAKGIVSLFLCMLKAKPKEKEVKEERNCENCKWGKELDNSTFGCSRPDEMKNRHCFDSVLWRYWQPKEVKEKKSCETCRFGTKDKYCEATYLGDVKKPFDDCKMKEYKFWQPKEVKNEYIIPPDNGITGGLQEVKEEKPDRSCKGCDWECNSCFIKEGIIEPWRCARYVNGYRCFKPKEVKEEEVKKEYPLCPRCKTPSVAGAHLTSNNKRSLYCVNGDCNYDVPFESLTTPIKGYKSTKEVKKEIDWDTINGITELIELVRELYEIRREK